MSQYGNKLKLTLFGEDESHKTGLVLDGVPAGTKIQKDEMTAALCRYGEAPFFEIVSGVFEEHATGAPLCLLFSAETSGKTADPIARPGLPGDLLFTKTHGFSDTRGDGIFTDRLHAPIIAAGCIARAVLREKDIQLFSHIRALAGVEDDALSAHPLTDETMEKLTHGKLPVLDKRKEMLMTLALEKAKHIGDTVGGQIECAVTGLPIGLGNPPFDGLESKLSALLFSFADVRGVSFGDGFEAAGHTGSQNNDEIFMDTLKGCPAAKSNHAGGIVGGLSNGMPLLFTVALRPSPKIQIEQSTVNFKLRHNTVLPPYDGQAPGVPEYPVLIESAAAIAIVDALLEN